MRLTRTVAALAATSTIFLAAGCGGGDSLEDGGSGGGGGGDKGKAVVGGQDFTEINTPKILGTATEGGANVFSVDYFGQQAYLSQSPQFYKQMAVGFFDCVFEVGPVFRAEPHATTRHLASYVSLDAEMGFIEDHTTVMAILTETIRAMVEAARSRPADLAIAEADVGKGKLVLCGPQILFRGQPHGTFKFLFNTIVRAGVKE